MFIYFLPIENGLLYKRIIARLGDIGEKLQSVDGTSRTPLFFDDEIMKELFKPENEESIKLHKKGLTWLSDEDFNKLVKRGKQNVPTEDVNEAARKVVKKILEPSNDINSIKLLAIKVTTDITGMENHIVVKSDELQQHFGHAITIEYFNGKEIKELKLLKRRFLMYFILTL